MGGPTRTYVVEVQDFSSKPFGSKRARRGFVFLREQGGTFWKRRGMVLPVLTNSVT